MAISQADVKVAIITGLVFAIATLVVRQVNQKVAGQK